MTTVLRVKRRLEESPAEALVLHCKRARIDDTVEPIPSLFMFSGTVNQEDNENGCINRLLLKDKNRNIIDATKEVSRIIKQLKDDRNSAYRKNRLKIVNYSRGLSINPENRNATDIETDSNFSILDLYNHESEKEEQKFAYDLYLSQSDDVSIDVIDIEGIHPLSGELVNSAFRDGKDSSDEGQDEDSNEENNWRNEYPDTEDDSVDEDDIIRAVQNMDLENDLSSEDDEEAIYGYAKNDTDAIKINKDDVERYGLAYAKYKSKILNRNNEEGVALPKLIEYDDSKAVKDDSGTVDEENVFFYPKNDDSDDNCSKKSKDSNDYSDIDEIFD
ncbi:female sterile (2) ltoPP43 [Arctopsyche grandis]|uniref:female sterile (2) ltoPP43 n=1 Tax=Arctopsyche grandis TaxID=121162 RepID=UPI00406D87FC